MFSRYLHGYWMETLPCAVLPEAAIGVGARWKVTHTLYAFDEPVRRSTSYRLLKLDGEMFEVEFQSVDDLSLRRDLPGFGRIQSSERSRTTGRALCSTSRLLPIELDLDKSNQVETKFPGSLPKQQQGELRLQVRPAASRRPE